MHNHALIELFEQRVLLSAGSLDPGFGKGGEVVDQESPVGYGLVTAVDSQTGDIIEAGNASMDAFYSPESVELQRYSSTGVLDLSFGFQGSVTNTNLVGVPLQAVAQPDEKILVLASYYTESPSTVITSLARFEPDGNLDLNFGTNGIVQVNSSAFVAESFLLLPGGDIVFAGNMPGATPTSALEELDSNGSPVMSFGTNGIATGAPGDFDKVTFDASNHLVAVGDSPSQTPGQYDGLIERFTADGQLDTLFGSDGSVIADDVQSFDNVDVESSDEIQAIGTVPEDGSEELYHFTSAGQSDASFGPGGSGFVWLSIPPPVDLQGSIFQPDGKLLLGISIQNPPGFFTAALARINPDGTLDGTFGSGGYADLGPGYALRSEVGGMTLQANGKIVLGNSDSSDQLQAPGLDFDPTRITANGEPDASFGVMGTAPGRPLFATGNALAEKGDGQTLAVGAVVVGGVDGIYIRRYNADGTLDSNFAPGLGYGGAGGYVFISVPPSSFYELPSVTRFVLDPFGRMLLGIPNYGIVRLTASGVLDGSFGTSGLAPFADFDDFALSSTGQLLVTSGLDTITRLTVNGAIDNTFGTSGSVMVPTSSGPIAVQPDGKILVGGAMNVDNTQFQGSTTSDLAVTRLNLNGTIDTTFGSDGTSTADYNKFDPGDYLVNNSETLSLTVLSNGNILAGGEAQVQSYTGGPSALTAAEFLPNGTVDTAFGDGGEINPIFPAPYLFFSCNLAGILVQSDGGLVFSGGAVGGNGSSYFLVRTTAAGILDTSFGTAGEVTTQFGPQAQSTDGSFDEILGATGAPDGKIIVIGDAAGSQDFSVGIALARYDLGLGTVSGTIFNDYSGDGVRQSNEAGLYGQTVYADVDNVGYWAYGDPETTTDSNGNYTLSGLPLGSYVIREILESGERQSFPLGIGQHVNVTTNALTGVNFGVTSKLYISGNVFDDANSDGKQEATEAGIGGWTVYADLNNDGKFESNEPHKLVNADGSFSFIALDAGTYIFRVIAPPGWQQTFPLNNMGQHVTLDAGGIDQNVNFGFVPSGSISGAVFNDADGDGRLDNGELGLAGWTVYIDLNNSGVFAGGDPTTKTGADGDFTFGGLPPGNYIVRVVAPAGWLQTYPSKNFAQHITLAPGEASGGVLFGEKKIA